MIDDRGCTGHPFDSPIEGLFAYHIEKYLAPQALLLPQFEARTLCGRFVLDFVIEGPDAARVGFECDGADFHDESRDEWRDAMILGDGFVDAIYRLRGTDLVHGVHDALYLIAQVEPQLFSEPGRANLASLASDRARAVELDPAETMIRLHRRETRSPEQRLMIEARHRRIPAGQRQFWQAAYACARELGGGSLDDVRDRYRGENVVAFPVGSE